MLQRAGISSKGFWKKPKPLVMVTACLMAVFAIATLVYSLHSGKAVNIVLCVAVLAALLLPQALEWMFRIEFSVTLTVFIMLYITCGALLGTVFGFYVYIPAYDKILHLVCGFLFALLGFIVWDILNPRGSAQPSLAFRVFVALFFAVAVAGLWELYEYIADSILGMNMQRHTVVYDLHSYFIGSNPFEMNIIKDISQVAVNGVDLGVGGYLDLGLIDTMQDMIANTIGALLFCIGAGMGKPGNWFARTFLPRILEGAGEAVGSID